MEADLIFSSLVITNFYFHYVALYTRLTKISFYFTFFHVCRTDVVLGYYVILGFNHLMHNIPKLSDTLIDSYKLKCQTRVQLLKLDNRNLLII